MIELVTYTRLENSYRIGADDIPELMSGKGPECNTERPQQRGDRKEIPVHGL